MADVDDEHSREDAGTALHAGCRAKAGNKARRSLIDAEAGNQGFNGDRQAAGAGPGRKGQDEQGHAFLQVVNGIDTMQHDGQDLNDELDDKGDIQGDDEDAHVEDACQAFLGNSVSQ